MTDFIILSMMDSTNTQIQMFILISMDMGLVSNIMVLDNGHHKANDHHQAKGSYQYED